MEHQRNRLIRRIVVGYLPYHDENGRILKIMPLNDDDLLEAEDVFEDAYVHCLDSGVMTESDYLYYLMSIGLWDEEKEKNLTEIIPKHIEEFLIKIFQSIFKSETRESTRKYLVKARETLNQLSHERHISYHLTCLGVANYARMKFAVERGLMRFDPAYTPNLNHACNFFLQNQLSDEIIRLLSHKQPWADIWSTHKRVGGQLFQSSSTSLTNEQQRLVLWSTMYDNIKEAADCPNEDVIDDDDALDGWLILQRRKYNQSKLESQANSLIKDKGAGEHFIVAETTDDIKRIKQMNNSFGQAIIKSRFNKIKNSEGNLTDVDFSDVKQDLQVQLNQLALNKGKR